MRSDKDSPHLAGVLIVWKNELLLLERVNGGYDIPKGHIMVGEKPVHAAVRECYEETRISLPVEPRFIGTEIQEGQTFYCYLHLTNKKYYVTTSNEHLGYRWMPIKEVPTIHPLVDTFVFKLNNIMEK